MTSLRTPILMAVLFFFLTQGFCSADGLPFFNTEDLLNSHDFNSYSETYQVNNLFGCKSSDKKKSHSAAGSGVTTEKFHKYLGYTTVLLAGLAAVTSGNKDVHYGAAYSTVAASLGTIATGYIAHGDRFTFEDGFFTEDNNHILLGTLGALGCITAVILADSSGGHGHNGIGVAGGCAMALSVITIRW